MADPAVARDVLIFAPTPRRVVFVIDGENVETDLYNFLDLPAKASMEVYHLEDEMHATREDFDKLLDLTREIVRRLCPKLAPEQLNGLVPSQMQAAISASHGVDGGTPREAGVTAASPSPSAGSFTDSPPSTTGDPTT